MAKTVQRFVRRFGNSKSTYVTLATEALAQVWVWLNDPFKITLSFDCGRLLMIFAILSGCVNAEEGSASIPSPDEPHQWMERTDGFDYGYEYSFYYDFCGQPQLGKALRKALVEKLISCPFSDAAKKHYIANAVDNEVKVQNEIFEYLKIYGKYPSLLKEARMDCSKIFNNAKGLESSKQLMLYDHGEIAFNEIIKLSCEEGGSTFSHQ